MTIGQEFSNELKLEAKVTRRFLEKVPFDQINFQPSEKSESIGRLAIHVAEILAWWTSVVKTDRLDFENFQPKNFKSTLELLDYFDDLLKEAVQSLENVDDAEFQNEWSMTHGEEVLFTLPKKQVARIFCMNHFIHHRAQLGVYLRLLNIDVPSTYGPSVDDNEVLLISRFDLI